LFVCLVVVFHFITISTVIKICYSYWRWRRE